MPFNTMMIAARFMMDSVRRSEEERRRHNNQEQQEKYNQQKESYSKETSSAVRSQALGCINASKPEKTDPKNLLYDNQKFSIDTYSVGLNSKVVGEEYGIKANDNFVEKYGGEKEPYDPSIKILHLELNEDTKFCKFGFGDEPSEKNNILVKKSDLEGLSPEEMKIKFELEKVPEKVSDVDVPSGTTVRAGLCHYLKSFGDRGNGIVYDLMGKDVGEVSNERALNAEVQTENKTEE